MTTTQSADSLITDSAAASGTALACGRKTLSGVIGMASDLKTAYAFNGYCDNTEIFQKILAIMDLSHSLPMK